MYKILPGNENIEYTHCFFTMALTHHNTCDCMSPEVLSDLRQNFFSLRAVVSGIVFRSQS